LTSETIQLQSGTAWPLGATLRDGGINFAVYSEHAEKILLAVFDGENDDAEREAALPGRTGFVWHGFLPDAGAGLRYGFRAFGPFEIDRGLRFNPSKLLLDPYARAISGHLTWNETVFDFQRSVGDHTIRNHADSAASVPKSVVVDPAFDWQGVESPRHSLADTVIYEVHVKGATELHPIMPEEMRGSYAGLGHPAMLDHFHSLGITALELLPVHTFIDDEFLVEKDLVNYWGYNSIGFFAPMARYAMSKDGGEPVREFKEMVRSLHSAGIEVFLDVVYNHTAEGGKSGPTLSFRGLDNPTYYRRPIDHPENYENFSGTGNTFNTQHPAVVALVLDSLRYWVEEMHIDGFRFDLAASLGRDASGFDTWSRLFSAIYQDPLLKTVKLIAEPWDLGPDGYQVGRFPHNWSEWNDRFRDATRSFWLGHNVTLGEFALRLTGSADLYDRPGRGPLATINFVTCHDGFDLTDLVSYNHKHNEENQEDNRDGSNDNLGYNFGVEGPTDDSDILDERYRARRNLLSTVMLSHGVPMLLGGDELSKTQGGNNNAYCQDNEISWLEWELDDRETEFLDFVRHVIALRNAYPSLRPLHYVESESPAPHEPGAVSWHDADGSELMPGPWGRQAPRVLMLMIVPSAGAEEQEPLLILFNASDDDAKFRVPETSNGESTEWNVLLDTAIGDGRSERTLTGGTSTLVARSSIVVATAR
jgi:glycogen operon protein